MPFTLSVFTDDFDYLERLGTLFSSDRVESANHYAEADLLGATQADALIASVSSDNILVLFSRLHAAADLPLRPLLVLLSESPIPNLPADLVLPLEWLPHALPTALVQRRDSLQLRHQLDLEIFRANAQQKRSTEEIQLLKNAIVRTVSHELKTPLLHVKSAVSMLAEDRVADRLKLVGYAIEATARLETVVKNITQLAESLEIELEPIHISDAVAYAVRNLRRSWEHKDNADRIRLDIPADLPLVMADKQGLGIALQLLLDNALKFSEKAVDLSVHVRDDTLCIAIRDSGIGIERDMLDKIFDPFYQIDHSDSRHFGGLGVGLAIARLILERHHTGIQVESKLGKGSAFSFALPLAEEFSSPII